VQVFGRRHDETIEALKRAATENLHRSRRVTLGLRPPPAKSAGSAELLVRLDHKPDLRRPFYARVLHCVLEVW
jgi:hypothetical protein